MNNANKTERIDIQFEGGDADEAFELFRLSVKKPQCAYLCVKQASLTTMAIEERSLVHWSIIYANNCVSTSISDQWLVAILLPLANFHTVSGNARFGIPPIYIANRS